VDVVVVVAVVVVTAAVAAVIAITIVTSASPAGKVLSAAPPTALFAFERGLAPAQL
jgi:hypothetical protein